MKSSNSDILQKLHFKLEAAVRPNHSFEPTPHGLARHQPRAGFAHFALVWRRTKPLVAAQFER